MHRNKQTRAIKYASKKSRARENQTFNTSTITC